MDEGGVEILSPDIITINNTDRPVGDFFMVIDVGPEFGFLEVRDRNGKSFCSLVWPFFLIQNLSTWNRSEEDQ